MPSQRRIRTFVVATAVILLILFYAHNSERRSDREFYDKTVKGLNDRAQAVKKSAEAVLHIQNKEEKRILQDAAEKSRIMDHEEERVQGDIGLKPITPAVVQDVPTPVPAVPKKWDMGKEETPMKEDKTDEELDVEAEFNAILKRSPIIIFSKTYCPHSKRAKSIFAKYSITPAPFIVELDEHKMGPQLQAQLGKITKRKTVPNVLVSGHSIGGGDEVAALDEADNLTSKIKELGGKRIMEMVLKSEKT